MKQSKSGIEGWAGMRLALWYWHLKRRSQHRAWEWVARRLPAQAVYWRVLMAWVEACGKDRQPDSVSVNEIMDIIIGNKEQPHG